MICAFSGKKLPLQGSGRAKKSYLHASDLSRAVLLLLTSQPGIYNAGPALPTSIFDVVKMCVEYCDKSVEEVVQVVDDRVGQDGQYWLDSSKLEALGWTPKVDWEKGLQEMWHWVIANPSLLTMNTDWEVRP